MELKYYCLEDDFDFEDRWYINRLCDNNGIELDSREFQYGQSLDLGPPISAKSWKEGSPVAASPPLRILLDPEIRGVPMDFTFSNEDMPIVTSKVSRIIASISPADIQLVPVIVESQEVAYDIMNVVHLVDCLDVHQSEIEWFAKGNEIRPDLAGSPQMIWKLVIDPARVQGHHIFRITGWEVEIVVSSIVKDAFEKACVSGVRYRQVSP
jgi:hypothetical protein